MKSLKSLQIILGNKTYLLVALVIVGLMVIVFTQKSCGGGYESPEYLELKGQFTAYKATAKQKEKQLHAMEKIVKEENASLRGKVDKLEIEKGEILIGTADRNKKIFEQGLELEDLRDKEAGIQDDKDLIFNLRQQISKLDSNFTLAIEDRDKYKAALGSANLQIKSLELIIDNKDILIDRFRVSLAAEIVARKSAEAVMAVGEKNNFLLKGLRFVGNGFKIYGMYAAGRDILKGAKL